MKTLISCIMLILMFRIVNGATTPEYKIENPQSGNSFHQFGYSVAIDGETMIAGAPYFYTSYPDVAAVYVRNSSGEWVLQAELSAADAVNSDEFGYSVAISGDTAVVGAYWDDVGTKTDCGSAYVFTRTGSTWTQQAKLTASDPVADDRFGWSVAISGDTVLVGVPFVDDVIDHWTATGAAYVFTRQAGVWSQQAKLISTDSVGGDRLGYSVALSGDTAILGAPWNTAKGSAYIYTRSGTAWSKQTKIQAADGTSYDWFGYSVSISGETALVGANRPYKGTPGTAYVFTRSGSTWSQQEKLLASNGVASDYFGSSVSLSGETAVVGTSCMEEGVAFKCSAYVFTRTGADWTQQAELTAADATARSFFGGAVAVSGDNIAVGACGDDFASTDSGAAYLFEGNGSSWAEVAKVARLDAADGNFFGDSVSLSDTVAVIGTPGDDHKGESSGAAYVFVHDGTQWNQQAKLVAADAAYRKNFGRSVSASGETAIIGATGDGKAGSYSGAAYIFAREGIAWIQQAKLKASDAQAWASFGAAVCVSADTAIIGASGEDTGGIDAGAAYIFQRNGSTWIEKAKLVAADAAIIDNFGSSVAVAGNLAVVAARYDDDKGSDSGSAYVFARDGSEWIQQAKLTASDGAASDNFGTAVAVSENRVIVGGKQQSGNSGAVYVFDWTGSAWVESQKIVPADGAAGDLFGSSLAIEGGLIAAGATGDDDGGSASGSIYIFKHNGVSWVQQWKFRASDAAANDGFGASVSLSTDRVLVGASGNDDPEYSSGAAYSFGFAIDSSARDWILYP